MTSGVFHDQWGVLDLPYEPVTAGCVTTATVSFIQNHEQRVDRVEERVRYGHLHVCDTETSHYNLTLIVTA